MTILRQTRWHRESDGTMTAMKTNSKYIYIFIYILFGRIRRILALLSGNVTGQQKMMNIYKTQRVTIVPMF